MLHPQARALLDLIEERGLPPMHTLTPVDARRFYYERRAITQPSAPEVGSIAELSANGPHGPIPLRLYKPLVAASGALPVLVYYHGGGWTIGDLDTHDTLCRELCNGSGCAVVSVDYRMGPENPFPAAVDDCVAATYWVRDAAGDLGLDPKRLGVGGDSAGGNLAAVVALIARDHGDLPICYQLLIYPATDMRAGAPSHTTNGKDYLLTNQTIKYYHDQYIHDPKEDLDWRASPLLRDDLTNLPPALVLTAGYDPLRDEGLLYADRLSESGNRCTYVCFERQIHGFITMGRVIDEANVAVAMCAAQMNASLSPSST